MTETRPGSRLRVGQLFGLSISALIVVGIVGLVGGTLALNSLGDARRRVVDRADPALVAVQTFLRAMSDQETGVLGYAVSADDASLEPYVRGRREAPAALAELRRLIGPQSEPVAAAATTWSRDYAAPTLAAIRSGSTAFTRAELRSGRQAFSRLRTEVDTLEAVLKDEREDARSDLEHTADRVRAGVIAFGLVSLLSALVAAVVLRRSVVLPVGRLAAQVRAVVLGGFDRRVEAGGAREIVSLGSDVDAMRERIAAEVATLERIRDELERSNTELEQFAYVASHDLQEPLRKIASFTQMLQSRYGGQLDERADTYMEFAVDGAKRMQDLINDLLAFSRVGRITEQQQVVDVELLVSLAKRSLAESIADSGAQIDVGPLPSVHGEPRLLELVFTNLIGNGIKFRGSDPPRISVRAERREHDWCFTVADNGIGIEPEYADRIFIIFQRLHPRAAYDGTGIGLSMCRKIVEYHGGTIWLEQTDEPGATFHFTLPAIEETPQ